MGVTCRSSRLNAKGKPRPLTGTGTGTRTGRIVSAMGAYRASSPLPHTGVISPPLWTARNAWRVPRVLGVPEVLGVVGVEGG